MKRSLSLSLVLIGFVGSPLLAQEQPKEPKQESSEDAEAKKLERRIRDLVDQLGAREYKVREQAFDQLVAIGPPAVPALEKAKQSKDPEVAASASEALSVIRQRHRLPKTQPKRQPKQGQPRQPGTQPTPRDPQQDPFGGLQPFDQDQMLDQLGKQFPEMRKLLEQMRGQNGPGFRLIDPDDPMFKDFFGGKNPFGEMFGQGDPGQGEREEFRSKDGRVRGFRWSNVPRRAEGPSGRLGVAFRQPSPVLRSHLDLPNAQGLVVNRLNRDSFAATQGLEQYDIVLSVDGKVVNNELDLRGLVAKGGKVQILRKGKRHELTFKPAPEVKEAAPTRPRPLRPRARPQPKPKQVPKPSDQRDF